jgi:hypothetical protein
MGWTAIAVAWLLWSGPLIDGHVHKAAHGGVIAHAGPYHLELVLADEAVEMWVLDQDERVVRLPADARLSLTFERPGQKLPPGYKVPGPKVLPLSLSRDHFRARPLSDFRNPGRVLVRVELHIGGKVHRAEIDCGPLDFKHRLYDGLDLAF